MTLRIVYNTLFEHHGPQQWWPGDTPFEIMVGAILTQNTAWTNVEKAVAHLKAHAALDPHAILAAPPQALAAWLQPSGYFNVKAQRLRNYCAWYVEQGGFTELQRLSTANLRRALLSVNGVGPETADDILLYAFERPVFVIDAYTRRLFSRLALMDRDSAYEHLRAEFETQLDLDAPLFNEYHALIVHHAKYVCTKRKPQCAACVLEKMCMKRDVT